MQFWSTVYEGPFGNESCSSGGVFCLNFIEVRDSARTGYLVPGRGGPAALPNGQNCWDVAVVAAVTWKLRSTFRRGNYNWRFSYGLGVVVRDLGEWRPGFYSEIRCASREHSGLAWGGILRNCLDLHCFQCYHVRFSRTCSKNGLGPKPWQGACVETLATCLKYNPRRIHTCSLYC